MKRSLKFVLGAALGLALFGATPTKAYAQNDVSQKIIPTLEYQAADVREALRALFRIVGVSYSIAPEVQGPITVSLKNVTFETALQNVLRQVDATYRVEGGVYQIIKREEPPAPGTGAESPTITQQNNTVIRRIKIRSADPMFIALLIGSDKGSQDFGLYPERSTIINGGRSGGGGGFGGGGFGGGGMGGGGFGGGGMGGGFGGGGMGMGGGMGRGGGRGGF